MTAASITANQFPIPVICVSILPEKLTINHILRPGYAALRIIIINNFSSAVFIRYIHHCPMIRRVLCNLIIHKVTIIGDAVYNLCLQGSLVIVFVSCNSIIRRNIFSYRLSYVSGNPPLFIRKVFPLSAQLTVCIVRQ